jgi:hypothetical protein
MYMTIFTRLKSDLKNFEVAKMLNTSLVSDSRFRLHPSNLHRDPGKTSSERRTNELLFTRLYQWQRNHLGAAIQLLSSRIRDRIEEAEVDPSASQCRQKQFEWTSRTNSC